MHFKPILQVNLQNINHMQEILHPYIYIIVEGKIRLLHYPQACL